MITSAAMAGVAVSQAAIASAEASRAKVERCKATVATFDSKTATVAESKGYAECIRVLHPDPMTAGETVFLKIAFLFVVACAVFGGWHAGGGYRPDFADRALGFFLYGLGIPFIVSIALAIVAGLVWVAS